RLDLARLLPRAGVRPQAPIRHPWVPAKISAIGQESPYFLTNFPMPHNWEPPTSSAGQVISSHLRSTTRGGPHGEHALPYDHETQGDPENMRSTLTRWAMAGSLVAGSMAAVLLP